MKRKKNFAVSGFANEMHDELQNMARLMRNDFFQ